MDPDRLAKVSEGQRACLRLVLRHMSSKDIARALAISPHTVDQRIRFAMKALGVDNRVDAARIVAAAEDGEAYQPLIHQSAGLDRRQPVPPDPLLEREARHGGRLPRMVWIMVVAAAAAVAFAGLFTGLNALAEFTR